MEETGSTQVCSELITINGIHLDFAIMTNKTLAKLYEIPTDHIGEKETTGKNELEYLAWQLEKKWAP